jgi:hypothetical protein
VQDQERLTNALDGKSDQYDLGSVLYELLSGEAALAKALARSPVDRSYEEQPDWVVQ